ncbi:MAG TPA: hypothetical protein VGD77_12045, partial [Gemmatimonadaceae bacterium]
PTAGRMPPSAAAGGYPPTPVAEPARRAGRGLRVGMAMLVVAVLVIAAWVALQGRRGGDDMAAARRDTGTAAGEVIPRSERLGTAPEVASPTAATPATPTNREALTNPPRTTPAPAPRPAADSVPATVPATDPATAPAPLPDTVPAPPPGAGQ